MVIEVFQVRMERGFSNPPSGQESPLSKNIESLYFQNLTALLARREGGVALQ
jgi:hypothetical protein